MPAIKCILFDCDNTLVLSEIAAFTACAQLANEILEKYNISKRYGGIELMHQFVGRNFRSMMAGLFEIHNFTMPADELDSYVDRELDLTISNLRKSAEPCKNVVPVLEKLHAENKYAKAIVSSSAMPRIIASIEKTGIDRFFGRADEGVFSAASSIDPPTSKPNPAIYLHACKKLGFEPSECIAIEDSRSGATAAKNAGIPLLGYVGPYYDEENPEEKVAAHVKLFADELGAFDVMHDWKDFESILNKFESS
ncbi:putative phosphatase YhcW [Colletotrichum sidae]|uniref:Phosphatase YhcW n=3 Tax=Colletotrichum orbiculare species complex TaxID=2707354 RepID=N4VJ35_COLOR|nr:putative phosphatase YhcW [Colletotrichum orbiculare MAFF 240422]TDZ28876.1 putative phosphatase YhcW [Colletotrichum spinosum]TEA14316.1 putative phosphatase YhcW [Colletotrichum sidae]